MNTTATVRTHADRARWYHDRGLRSLRECEVSRAHELFRRAIVHDVLFEDPYRELMASSRESRSAHRFSVVVATWNRLADLKRCIDSIRHNSFYANEIIVVDNHSSDGTVEYLQAQPDVHVILNDGEITTTRAYNAGLAVATGDFLGLLNDDNEVMPGWDLALVETLAGDRRAGVGVPLIIHADGRVQTPGHHNPYVSLTHQWIGRVEHIDTSRVVDGSLADHPAFHQPRECDYALFPFLTRECFDRVGGFDERFTHHFADPDLGYRVQQAGYRNLYCPTSVIVHHDLGRHNPGRRTPQFEAGLQKFTDKWLLLMKDEAVDARRSYAYLDSYVLHLDASRQQEGSAGGPADVADLATWIPEGRQDVVDIGSDSAGVVRYLRDVCGKNAFSLNATAQEGVPGVPALVGDMSFLPLGFTACDVVVARYALSRSVWPVLTLMEFNRVLDPGGFALLTLPPCDDFWIRHPSHRSVLNEAQWRRLFADAGFRVVRAETPDSAAGCGEQRYLLQKQRTLIEPVRVAFSSAA